MSGKTKLHDVVWLAAGQGVAAVGALIGVRLLTHALPPETYGVVSLGLATLALMIATLSTPLTQAVMHMYPAYDQQGRLQELRVALGLASKRMLRWAAIPLLLLVVACMFVAREQLHLLLLLLVLLASDVRRSVQISVLNASRRHGRYALWAASDAWARPIAGAVAVMIVGQSAAAVFVAYLIASVSLTALFSSPLWGAASAAGATQTSSAEDITELGERMWRYALPLIPVGLIAWSNSLSDRFIIGGMLGLDVVGVYAATYGLSSAPFIMLTTVLEQAFRPVYQNAVTAGRHADANRQLLRWLVVAIVATSVGVLAFVAWREYAAAIFLGPQYRSAVDLMPWIAAGSAVRTIAYVLDRVCYAYGRTGRVLMNQLCAVVATVVITPVAIAIAGLPGAAMAVPVCFLIHLCAATFNAIRTQRESSVTFAERTAERSSVERWDMLPSTAAEPRTVPPRSGL